MSFLAVKSSCDWSQGMTCSRLRVVGGILTAVFAVLPALMAKTGPTIQLSVDASEAARKIFHARLKIPATPGTLTLYYPKWIPGEHAPDGPVTNLAGLRFSANGQELKWRRDTLDGWTINVQVPPGQKQVEATLDFLSPAQFEGGFSAGSSATAQMAVVSWNQVLLYPKGWASDDLTYVASLRLPSGWKFGTPLPIKTRSAEQIQFAPASLTMLVDSPVIAGQYLKVVPLQAEAPPAEMDIAADSAAALDAPPEVWDHYRNLVAQAARLFGAQHYRDYHFLYSLSDHVAHFGLEHHESDDSRVDERSLVDPTKRILHSGLLPHEYVHSWNGKYRRPADLATPDYQQPMQDDLLWVYEGLTSYLGDILTARSSLWNPDQFRDSLALTAAALDHEPGRSWRNLQDTADAAPQLYFSPREWYSWRRGTDFYAEDVLNWLWVDVIIRQKTQGNKSIDDFCHLFHGPPAGPPMVKPYNFDDVVNTLNQIVAYDWRDFWTERLSDHGPGAPLGGIEGSGWRVVYDENRSEILKATESEYKIVSAEYSIGLALNDEGVVSDAVEGMPAAKAGIGPGMKIIAVNGRHFSGNVLRDALRTGKSSSEPLELLVENAEYYQTYKLDYSGGEKYPHLVRDSSKPDLLSEIIRPR
ncbi:MAG: peptidase M61 [Acidobacteria bacterium]|nr:MAG: peptidase M61 [Acidobacteriota bacterium]PYY09639.1 MAG: peptidase M61 [Acidobacteriota bacterium]